jgi:hypothetical protein
MTDPERFKKLPDRIRVEDLVEEVPADNPPEEDPRDPTTGVAWRWGPAGL